MTERRSINTLKVICDDHPKSPGKKSTWVFTRDDEGAWRLDPCGPSRTGLYDDPERDGYRFDVACNLCPDKRLEFKENGDMQRVLDAAVRVLLELGETREVPTVPLRMLTLLASRRT
ncbi:hypothetical protein [Mycobacterium sp. 1423905.2]|uniref:hypothetical protein n=1 Tax=Mycobacterium sp. 1423905.2 TaxID=1856859 RepID=UPI0012E9BB8F|nr:hypothetical protein [Mycobacterium sp. 1423905.2]